MSKDEGGFLPPELRLQFVNTSVAAANARKSMGFLNMVIRYQKLVQTEDTCLFCLLQFAIDSPIGIEY